MNALRHRFLLGSLALSLSFSLGLLGCGSTGQSAPPAVPKAAPAAAVRPEDTEKVILDRDAKRIEAMVQGDLKTLTEILRDDMTYVHSSGPIEGKAEIMAEIESGKLRYKAIEPSQMMVRLYGDSAIVTGRALLKVTSQGRALAFSVRFTEVWLREKGTWQLAAWQSTRIPES